MNDKKKLIQIGLVTVMFLGMAIILYRGFFGGASSPSAGVTAVNIASVTPESLLPYGKTFNYQAVDNLQKMGFEYGQIVYPTLSTSTDVGKDVNSLIEPLPTQQPGQ